LTALARCMPCPCIQRTSALSGHKRLGKPKRTQGLQLIGACIKLANSLAEASLTVHDTHMTRLTVSYCKSQTQSLHNQWHSCMSNVLSPRHACARSVWSAKLTCSRGCPKSSTGCNQIYREHASCAVQSGRHSRHGAAIVHQQLRW